jgi:uncharacterized LabA/DUF88 family protein
LFELIAKLTGVRQFDLISYHTADDVKSSKKKHIQALESLGVKVDMREFKTRTVKCRNPDCHLSQKGFKDKVQAEVDVAIAIKGVEQVMLQASTVVLITGD